MKLNHVCAPISEAILEVPGDGVREMRPPVQVEAGLADGMKPVSCHEPVGARR